MEQEENKKSEGFAGPQKCFCIICFQEFNDEANLTIHMNEIHGLGSVIGLLLVPTIFKKVK